MRERLLSARFYFKAIIFAISFLTLCDHLSSPQSKAVVSQSDGKACAPCGAPCMLTEK